MDVRISTDPAADAARCVVEHLRQSVNDNGAASLAVSGGSTAPGLFHAMVGEDLHWDSVEVWQVDERIAPEGDDDRNAGQLAVLPARINLMPVTTDDLAAAAADYAASLPARFDVVHLGLGDDGHTASWAPAPHPDADRAVTSTEPVFTIGSFNGRRRMTLGVGVVNAARKRVVLVTGANKADVVRRWIDGADEHGGAWTDPTLPIAAVRAEDTVVFLDAAAAGSLHLETIDAIQADPADGYGRAR